MGGGGGGWVGAGKEKKKVWELIREEQLFIYIFRIRTHVMCVQNNI